ncbi:MAG: ATP-binding cassette domain-containing protein [Clostridia bacterium]|nr:ATP-binding cassette domain-containing protein [Clostridia bacterium]
MLIELNNVSIHLGQRQIFDDFCLQIEKNDRILLLGENGSGKTTLLNYICRHFKKICRISYLRQNDMLLPYNTVFQNLRLAGGEARATQFLERLQLEEYKNDYPYQLSGGIHRQLLILRALLFPYDLLLLDEPLANLDAAAIPAVCEMMEKETENRALLVSAHQNAEALAFTNKTVIVYKKRGKIVS